MIRNMLTGALPEIGISLNNLSEVSLSIVRSNPFIFASDQSVKMPSNVSPNLNENALQLQYTGQIFLRLDCNASITGQFGQSQ